MKLTVKWYCRNGLLRGCEQVPALIADGAVYKLARRKSRYGFASVLKNGKFHWYKGGKTIKP